MISGDWGATRFSGRAFLVLPMLFLCHCEPTGGWRGNLTRLIEIASSPKLLAMTIFHNTFFGITLSAARKICHTRGLRLPRSNNPLLCPFNYTQDRRGLNMRFFAALRMTKKWIPVFTGMTEKASPCRTSAGSVEQRRLNKRELFWGVVLLTMVCRGSGSGQDGFGDNRPA